MADFQKHRRENIDVAIGFADRLTSGDGLTSIEDVIITAIGETTDVSSEFGSPGGTINGDDVELTLDETTTSGEQSKGTYEILVDTQTSDGDSLVAQDAEGNLPTIEITTKGDPTV